MRFSHLTNLLLHNYYYRGKSQRKIIRDLVSTDNIAEAQTRLNAAITEHDNYITSSNIPNTGDTFTSVDNLSLHHCKDHLDAFQNDITQEIQKEAATNALDES